MRLVGPFRLSAPCARSSEIACSGAGSLRWDAFDSDDESSDHIDDEHRAIFDCSGYVYAREHFQDRVQSNITTVSQLVNQPQSNQLAKSLTEIRMLGMNRA